MSDYTELSIRADIAGWACLTISQVWLVEGHAAWGAIWVGAALLCRLAGWWADRKRRP